MAVRPEVQLQQAEFSSASVVSVPAASSTLVGANVTPVVAEPHGPFGLRGTAQASFASIAATSRAPPVAPIPTRFGRFSRPPAPAIRSDVPGGATRFPPAARGGSNPFQFRAARLQTATTTPTPEVAASAMPTASGNAVFTSALPAPAISTSAAASSEAHQQAQTPLIATASVLVPPPLFSSIAPPRVFANQPTSPQAMIGNVLSATEQAGSPMAGGESASASSDAGAGSGSVPATLPTPQQQQQQVLSYRNPGQAVYSTMPSRFPPQGGFRRGFARPGFRPGFGPPRA